MNKVKINQAIKLLDNKVFFDIHYKNLELSLQIDRNTLSCDKDQTCNLSQALLFNATFFKHIAIKDFFEKDLYNNVTNSGRLAKLAMTNYLDISDISELRDFFVYLLDNINSQTIYN